MIHTQDPDFTLYVGDVREEIKAIADGSVDCVVTSPPYWGLRDYGVAGQIGMEETPEEFVETMVLLFREIRRVLKTSGTCWLNLGDSYVPDHAQRRSPMPEGKHNWGIQSGTPGSRARDGHGPQGVLKAKELVGIPWRVALALQADGWWLRCDNIWEKLGGMPESVTDRPTRNHEYVFMLTVSESYFYDQDAVREPYSTKHAPGTRVAETDHYGADNGGNSGLSGELAKVKARLRERPGQETLSPELPPEAPRGPDGRRQTHVKAGAHSAQHRDGERWADDGRNMRSVWEIATAQLKEAHFAVFPEDLPRRCILAGSPLGGVVLDPFMGSGTTARVARAAGRRCIGIELSPEYADLIAARTQQQSLLA